jgi:hypothetical protein
MTTVVNIKNNEPYDIYIGRAGHGQRGPFGNPHVVGWCAICQKEHKRGEAVEAYREYFNRKIANDALFRKEVLKLKDKRLGCFCKSPSGEGSCHGDVIKEYLDNEEKHN